MLARTKSRERSESSAANVDRRNGDHCEENKRLFAAAGKDPVVDFQHVKGRRQRQHGHRRAEENRVCEQPPARRNGLEQRVDFGFRDQRWRLQSTASGRVEGYHGSSCEAMNAKASVKN